MKIKFRVLAVCMLAVLMLTGCVSTGGTATPSGASATPTIEVTVTATTTPDVAEDILSMLDAAMVKTDALTALDITTGEKCTMTVDDSVISVSNKISLQCGDVNADKLEAMLEQTTELLGQTIEASAYFAPDGNMYMTSQGLKTKKAITLNEFLMQSQSNDKESLPAFTKDMLKDATVTDTQDGKQIEFAVEGEKLKAFALENWGLSDTVEGENISKFNDINFTFLIDKNGYCSKYTIAFELECTLMETAGTKISMELSQEIRNPGEPVVITPPTDLDTYKSDDTSL